MACAMGYFLSPAYAGYSAAVLLEDEVTVTRNPVPETRETVKYRLA